MPAPFGYDPYSFGSLPRAPLGNFAGSYYYGKDLKSMMRDMATPVGGLATSATADPLTADIMAQWAGIPADLANRGIADSGAGQAGYKDLLTSTNSAMLDALLKGTATQTGRSTGKLQSMADLGGQAGQSAFGLNSAKLRQNMAQQAGMNTSTGNALGFGSGMFSNLLGPNGILMGPGDAGMFSDIAGKLGLQNAMQSVMSGGSGLGGLGSLFSGGSSVLPILGGSDLGAASLGGAGDLAGIFGSGGTDLASMAGFMSLFAAA